MGFLLYNHAVNLIMLFLRSVSFSVIKLPTVDYYKAYLSGNNEYLNKAFSDSQYCCFPNRIQNTAVLEYAIKNNPMDFNAPYYLGNLYYNKERHADAIQSFELSVNRGANFELLIVIYHFSAIMCLKINKKHLNLNQ